MQVNKIIDQPISAEAVEKRFEVTNEDVKDKFQEVVGTSEYYEHYLENKQAISEQEEIRIQGEADKTDGESNQLSYSDYAYGPEVVADQSARYEKQKAEEDRVRGQFEKNYYENDRMLIENITMDDMDDLMELAVKNYYQWDERVESLQKKWEDNMRSEEEYIGMGSAAALAYMDEIMDPITTTLVDAKGELKISLELAMEIRHLMDVKEEQDEAVRREDKTYVAEMAKIQCSEGLRKSYLMVPEPHHVYIKGIPLCTVNEAIPDVNLINFGGCTSKSNLKMEDSAKKVVDEFVKLYNKEPPEEYKIEDLKEFCACPCTPEILTTWIDGQEGVEIDGGAPLLRKCEIFCQHGGKIVFRTSGQPK